MEVKETGLEGLIEITPSIYGDERGWFFELYKETSFKQHNLPTSFLQENQSFSKKGVIRGLHLQKKPHAQGKLVTVISGKVMDVVVDLRTESKTFKKVYYCLLESERRNMLYVPEGFAHGFVALEDTIFLYKCTNIYNKQAETGIVWNDPELNIDWKIDNPIVSEKDKELPTLKEFLKNM